MPADRLWTSQWPRQRSYFTKIWVNSWWCGKNLTYDVCNDGAIGSDCSNGAGESGAGNAKVPFVESNAPMKWANLGLYDPSVRGAMNALNTSTAAV